MQQKYIAEYSDDNVFINASILPNENLTNEINSLKINCALMKNGALVAVKLSEKLFNDFKQVQSYIEKKKIAVVSSTSEFVKIKFSWDIFKLNEKAIISDFKLTSLEIILV